MKTEVLKINDIHKDLVKIKKAAKLIRDGEVVAFPTETVYGLGANALDASAVKRIFAVKGRPLDNPLIVHISSIEDTGKVAKEVPEKAFKLAEAFWPGPLTLILKKKAVIPLEVTAGLDTVAVRLPAHPVARALIEESGVPLAAPSANRSGRPSPVIAGHVLEDMEGKIPLILDGGRCAVGLESTVVDVTRDVPVILRPGGITVKMLENILGEVEVDSCVLKQAIFSEQVRSPGMKYTHYAPRAPVIVVRGDINKISGKIQEMARYYEEQGKRVGILATEETRERYRDGVVAVMGTREQPATIASNLFYLLREMDEEGVDIILAEGIEEEEEGLAVMNRMLRASGFNVIDV